MCVAEAGDYNMTAERGDTRVLWCNSSKSSEVQWTHRTTDKDHTYVYFNGSSGGRYGTEDRYSFVTSSNGVPGLRIYNAQPVDSGYFECDEKHGDIHRDRYQLNVTGTLYVSLHLPECVKLYSFRQTQQRHNRRRCG